jgi:hypothetical protein
MRGDFDEDEIDDFEPEWEAYDDDDICVDCQRTINGEDQCSVCGAAMCFACFEMGAGVCMRQHK